MKLKTSKTNRGFSLVEFEDSYGVKCTLQKSSLATADAIWLGVHDAKPIGSRMHLTRNQVKKLLPILQRFVETGEI